MRKGIRGLFAPFAIALCVTLFAACSASEATTTTAGSPSSSSTPSPSATSTTAVTGGAKGGPEVTTEPAQAPVPTGSVTLQQAAPPQSTGNPAGSTYTVGQYIGYIAGSADTYWSAWMRNGYGLAEPYVYIEIVEPGEAPYQTNCKVPGGGTPPPTTDDFPNAFYCGVDSMTGSDGVLYEGVVVFPATTFQKMWSGDILGTQSRTAGDFAAAYVISHEFAHHIVHEFASQLEAAGQPMPEITGKNNELLADCFAGAWINYAYSQGVLTDTDYAEAIAAAEAVGDKPGTISQDPHGTPEERMYALRVGAELGANGYPAGNPGACTSTYWQ